MFDVQRSMDDVTYFSLMDALARKALTVLEAKQTLSPSSTGPWCRALQASLRGILDCILPRISPKDRLVFFDLADPTKRDPNELRTTPEIISRYARFGRVGLLPSEAIRMGALAATAYVTNGFSPDVDCLKM